MQSTAADPLLGQVLEGRYRVLSRLAVGGMSTVYVAIDERLDREIAVKVMNPTLSIDPAFVDRFSREARAAAKLSHVNAVAVYDQGSDGDNVFLVMELVRGRTLRDLIRERGRLAPPEAVSLMEPVLAALAAAHRAGLVHRDVKPENILLSDEGVVKVADFGLARAVETNASSTRTGQMMGTVAYSSPEQFRGHHVDMRSDVYSSGIVLFELLTGHPPYQGADAMAVAYQHVHSDVPPPSTRQRGIAPPLDRLVLRATSRDPQRRPPDAGILLAELHDVRQELRLPVLPVPRRPRPAAARTGPTTPIHPVPPRQPGPPGPPGPPVATPRPAPGRTGPLSATAPTARPPGASRPLGPPPGSTGRVPLPGHTFPAPKKRRWVRTTVGAVVLLLVCALLIVGSWWWAAGRYSSLHDVKQQPLTAAVANLKDQGYKVVVDPAVASDTVAKGAVVSTDPNAGARLVRGRTVHIVPSAGPAFYPVPAIGADMTKDQAAVALKPLADKGVTITYQQASSDKVAEGNVISTNPAAAAQVKRGDAVVVTISTGLPIIAVPNVVGKSIDDAKATLSSTGFQVTASQQYSDSVKTGVVISQNPGPSQQRQNTPIALVVSLGPQYVTVPPVSGKSSAAARQLLEQAGFAVKINRVYGGNLDITVGLAAADADKNAQGQVRKGATITIDVA